MKLQLPLPSAVTCPIGLPLPSVRVTVAPGSAVPLISAPLLGLTTGAAGATESTVVVAGALVLPVGSLAVALTTVPLASGVPGVKLQLPLPSAVTWPIVALERMPLSPNGKLDRKALPAPEVSVAQAGYSAPRNAVERTLAEIWQDLLGVERVGLDDNFFSLGGDSIVSIQVVSRARQAGLQLSPRDLFQHQNIRS